MEGIEGEKRTAFENIESRRDVIFEMSDTIFHFAEPGLREYKSSKLLVNYLKREGFEVEEGISGMPTAFIAKWEEGIPR